MFFVKIDLLVNRTFSVANIKGVFNHLLIYMFHDLAEYILQQSCAF